ncbi:hypothetical protein D3C76_1368270 [compost metagenome]
MAQAVEQIAGRHVIGTVQHHVAGGNLRRHLLVIQLCVQGINTDMRIDGAQLNAGRFDLRHTNAVIPVQDLAL